MSGTVAAVAPAAPAAGYAVLGIGLLCSFIVAWGLQSAWRATFGPLLTWLGNLGISAGRGVFRINVHPFRFALKANTAIERWLSQAVALSERGVVWAFGHMMQLLQLIASTTEQLARETYHWAARTSHATRTTVTRTIRETVVKPVATTVRVVDARVTARVNSLTAEVSALAAHIRSIAAALPHDIATVPARVGITSKQLRRASKRLSALEKATVGLGAVALVTAALGRMGLGFLRCPSLLRMGKRLGCVGFGWLEGFFATAFEALVVLDLCRFALAAQQLARIIVPQLAGTLLVQNAVCLGGGAQYPSAHDAPKVRTKLTLPSAHD